MFDMIEYYESATHLNISFNKHIGTRGWQAAAHMMRKVRTEALGCSGATVALARWGQPAVGVGGGQ